MTFMLAYAGLAVIIWILAKKLFMALVWDQRQWRIARTAHKKRGGVS